MDEDQKFVPDLLERANRVWNNGNFMVFDELYAPDVIHYHPGMGVLEGSQSLAVYIRNLRAQYPDLVITFEETIFDGEKMVCQWRLKGTDMGMHAASAGPPTGKNVDIKGAEVMYFRDGKIVEDHVYYDQYALLQQLGLLEQFGVGGDQ